MNTACSTSAVAVHLAIQSLLAGESDLALAGGCRIRIPATVGYVYQEDGIPSPDGHCRAFDADARGTVFASGAAVVVLKRLSDADTRRDTIYAVIKGSAVNNDGSAKIGFTAPSIEGQAAVIEEALAVAEVDADTIGIVEAHGTGTSLGDPIEVAALTQRLPTRHEPPPVLRHRLAEDQHRPPRRGGRRGRAHQGGARRCTTGRSRPASTSASPTRRSTSPPARSSSTRSCATWPRSTQPRRAAVSAFGLGRHERARDPRGGAAACARPRSPRREPAGHHAEREVTQRAGPDGCRAGCPPRGRTPTRTSRPMSPTRCQTGRATLPHRRSFVATSSDEAVRLLRTPDPHAVANRVTPGDGARVAFLFPGQGAQYPGMGAAPVRQRAGVRRGDGRVREDPRARSSAVTSWTSSSRGRAIRRRLPRSSARPRSRSRRRSRSSTRSPACG